jgi:hypothetical protein
MTIQRSIQTFLNLKMNSNFNLIQENKQRRVSQTPKIKNSSHFSN